MEGWNSRIIKRKYKKSRTVTTNPIGVNLMLMRPDIEDQINVCIEEKLKL